MTQTAHACNPKRPCALCKRSVHLIPRGVKVKAAPARTQIPVCSHLGGELTAAERQARGLDSRRWARCFW